MGSRKHPPAKMPLAVRELSASDSDLLRAARRLLDETTNAAESAGSSVIAVVDPHDPLGARLVGMAIEVDTTDPQERAAFRRALRRSTRTRRKRTIVALWVPKVVVARMMHSHDGRPSEEHIASLDQCGHSGFVPTLLVREGRSMLCAIDYTRVDAMHGDVLKLSGGTGSTH